MTNDIPFPTPVSKNQTPQTLYLQTLLQFLHRNLAVQRTFHRQLPNRPWTLYCGHIPLDEIGVDDLAGVFHEVLDDPILFERFGPQSMPVVIAEDDVRVHWFQTPLYEVWLIREVGPAVCHLYDDSRCLFRQ